MQESEIEYEVKKFNSQNFPEIPLNSKLMRCRTCQFWTNSSSGLGNCLKFISSYEKRSETRIGTDEENIAWIEDILKFETPFTLERLKAQSKEPRDFYVFPKEALVCDPSSHENQWGGGGRNVPQTGPEFGCILWEARINKKQN